jgi:hypothetical protein
MICITCGVQSEASECAICLDPRQYVGLHGQQWTTQNSLQATHRNECKEEEPGVWSIHTEPAFAIGQRAFLIQTGEGNLMWDCVSLLDLDTIAKINELGGIQAMAVSHPHYYGTMADWSGTFDAPLWIHKNDEQWVAQHPAKLHFWDGPSRALFGGVTLVLSSGHFRGYQVAHWNRSPGILFAGDQPQVCMDRRWVSFLYSYPNMIPFSAATVKRIAASLALYSFDRLYGAFGRHVLSDAKGVIARSVERYLQALESETEL